MAKKSLPEQLDPKEGMGAADRWYLLHWDRNGRRCWHRYGATGRTQGDLWLRYPEKDSWKPSLKVRKAFRDALVKRREMK